LLPRLVGQVNRPTWLGNTITTMYVKQCDCLNHYLFVCFHAYRRDGCPIYFLTHPHCIISTECYMNVIISAGHTLPAEFRPEPTEGSYKSHASPLPHPDHLVPLHLITCQTIPVQSKFDTSITCVWRHDLDTLGCYNWLFGRIEKMSKISFFVVTPAQSCWTVVDSTKSVSAEPDQTFEMLLIGFVVKIRSKNLIRVWF
jgi:hypothetical protein